MRFSLLWLMVLTALFSLAAALVASRYELSAANRSIAQLRSELDLTRPIEFWHVAFLFEQQLTNVHPVVVTNVHYNALRDLYTVDYEWTQDSTGRTVGTSTALISDGDGSYECEIKHPPFAKTVASGYAESASIKIVVRDVVANALQVDEQYGRRDELLDRLFGESKR